ncbi:3-isopropylmalate dehydratase small subunit [Micromonospora echinofusca]|uniref:3-isopropylmalate dehydratase small subunit n=1 Tax=Micromonospora echinofusca TaxID=47858 RepID=A0ABS3VU42_MICEH|nr:3-isopropylmalate dehydratase small subunit [Micromonospora echinofusca]MBO4208055.1 3-isopropylmalate dehydratase small subunit [Micromonospora echinofusca]
MRAVSEHTGRGVALRRDDVDTDQIIPAEFCKRLTKSGYADTLFANWFTDPAFVLNQPDRAGASVLVAGHNFGTGSSREHAVWALRDWGFRAVVATSFGDIFLRNAWKNGLLAVVLPEPAVAELADRVDADPAFPVTVDVVRTEVRAAGSRWSFEVDERARWLLLNGLDDIGLTLGRDAAISAYERARRPWLPTLHRGRFGTAVTVGEQR